MAKTIRLLFATGLLQAAQPAAAACLPTSEVATRMDEYFDNPRAPATYRALAGMGDPRIPAFTYAYSGQESLFRASLEWDERKALTARMLPEQRPDPTYWQPDEGRCRLDHPLWLARARVAALGAEHPYVRQWLAVQKAVFEACINRTSEGASPLPGPIRLADPALAALQAEDRAYQQATRLFYEKSPRAPEAFRRIAASPSRHAPVARYMMLVLKVEQPAPPPAAAPTRPVPEDDQGAPPMIFVGESRSAGPVRDIPSIIADADRILADPRFARIHPLVQGLIGSLAWRYNARDWMLYEGELPDPATPLLFKAQVRLILAALKIPAGRLRTDPVARELYARAAADVGKIHRRHPDDPAWWLTGHIPEDAYGSRAMAAAAKTDRFAAWLLYPPSPFRTMAWGRAGRTLNWDSRLHWVTNDGHGADSLAWRVAGEAASRDEGGWGMIDEMAGKARACADEDATLAALPELFYHQVRKSLTYRHYGAAEEKSFAAALDHLATWPWRDSEHHRETVAAALRYLIEVGRVREARRLRDRLLPAAPADHRYDPALLLLAEDEAHFAAALAGGGDRGRERLLNILSSSALQRLAARPDLAAEDRARFARIAWSRLYALGRPVPARLDRLMRRLNPEVTGKWRSRPGASPRDRLLLLDVLGSPALNILITDHQRPYHPAYGKEPGLTEIDTFQHSDNNWWCAWQPERHEGALDDLLYRIFFSGPAEDEDEFDPLAVAGARRVLSPLLESSWLWARRDLAEERALSQIASAPKLLAERAIAWRGRAAAGQDEALALAVRATRYGCQRQGGHGAYSQKAFALLHRLHPGSEAAKRTRYWFD